MGGRARDVAEQRSPILSWLQQREDEMAALLAELVAIPTENPPGKNYRACANLLENRLKQVGLDCERLETGATKECTADVPVCLVAGYGRGERVLYFHGHYDVVPAQSREQFQPARKEHFLFGRGSCDMKGGIVAMLYAILALRECGAELGGRIRWCWFPMKRREAKVARRGWRPRGGSAAAASACFWLRRPVASCGTQTAGPFRCAFVCSENLRTLDCNTRGKTRSSACFKSLSSSGN